MMNSDESAAFRVRFHHFFELGRVDHLFYMIISNRPVSFSIRMQWANGLFAFAGGFDLDAVFTFLADCLLFGTSFESDPFSEGPDWAVF